MPLLLFGGSRLWVLEDLDSIDLVDRSALDDRDDDPDEVGLAWAVLGTTRGQRPA
jgi:hypothetical protein